MKKAEKMKMGKVKKCLAGILAFVLVLTGVPMYGMEVKAAEERLLEGDFSYSLNENEDRATITGYNGDGGDITIPSEIDGIKVTSIGYGAFSECSSLSSINIPEGVTNISAYAFLACSSLTEVSIPDSVTTIGDCAFLECSSLTNANIPDGVTSIGNHAFSDCKKLTSITIPAGTTYIGTSTGCSSLTSIKVEEGNKTYDSRNNCNAVIDTESNTLIWGCNATVIPTDITGIGGNAFSGCSGLTSISIPSGVTNIGGRVFSYCSSLEEITVAKGNTMYDSRDDCNAIIDTTKNMLIYGCNNTKIPDGVTIIGNDAFLGSGLTSITIPDSVTSIWNDVFENCSSLTSISIPNSVTFIGDFTFRECSSLTNVTIPDSVTKLGNYLFADCSSLTSISIPSRVTEIWSSTFEGCSNLADIKVAEGNAAYDSRGNCNAIINKTNNELVRGCKNTIIPDSVTKIGYHAFYKCSDLTEITIPGSVANIESEAFYKCSDLTEITIPGSVTAIGRMAFSDCSNLTEITIPSSVTTIGDHALGYSYPSIDKWVKMPNFVISGYADSAAETYAKNHEFEFVEISANDISHAAVLLEKNHYEYDGTAKTPSVTVKIGEKTLTLNEDYTIAYTDNIEEGTATVKVTGKGSYTGSAAVNFTISRSGGAETPGKTDISNAAVTLDKTSYTYNGTAKTPSVTVKLNGKTLTFNTDYTVSYSNNTNVGTAAVTITGKGSYTGIKTVYFTIAKAAEDSDTSITCKKTVYKVTYGAKPFKINASSKSKLTFISSNSAIAAVNKTSGQVTIKGTGTATITVSTGKHSVKVTVKVNPKKLSVKSLKAAKGRKLTVKWAKDKMVTGYQVQVSTDKNFKKDLKKKTVSKTSYTFTKLKIGKRYYVRIRSYKKSGRETLYGTWSNVKQSNKIKK